MTDIKGFGAAFTRRFIIQNIRVPLRADTAFGYDKECIKQAKRFVKKSRFFSGCGVPRFEIFKKSIDARDKNAILFVYSVALSFEGKVLDTQGTV